MIKKNYFDQNNFNIQSFLLFFFLIFIKKQRKKNQNYLFLLKDYIIIISW